MRHASLSLLFALSLATTLLHAEEGTTGPTIERQAELVQRLAENEQQSEELKARAAPAATDAKLAALRQENHRLLTLLQQQQQQQQPQLLNDQQQWFAVGGGVGVFGFLLGVLTARGRRRRQWLN